MKDNFSRQSEAYARFRPRYPRALFDFISIHTPSKNYAWDAGTGNGQSAVELAVIFDQVIATDISKKQLAQAPLLSNIDFRLEPSEQTTIPSGVVNLVTVSQALHWFDLQKFYAEVKRVAAPGAMIAVWTYSLLTIEPGLDDKIRAFNFDTLRGYWDKERVHVDNGYKEIPFPFKTISCPLFFIETEWSLAEMVGYIETWSGVSNYEKRENHSPVPALRQEIERYWNESEKKKIRFPVHLKMGYIQ